MDIVDRALAYWEDFIAWEICRKLSKLQTYNLYSNIKYINESDWEYHVRDIFHEQNFYLGGCLTILEDLSLSSVIEAQYRYVCSNCKCISREYYDVCDKCKNGKLRKDWIEIDYLCVSLLKKELYGIIDESFKGIID